MNQQATLVSLFTGAGGLDLGLEEAGFTTIVANEIVHSYCETLRRNKVLSRLQASEFDYFIGDVLGQKCYNHIRPHHRKELIGRLRHALGARAHMVDTNVIEGDIRRLKARHLLNLTGGTRGTVTLVAGGPPCQPFSRAGNRRGVDDPSNGSLFVEFARIVDELKPRWFLFENVKGLSLTKTELLTIACRRCGNKQLASFESRINWHPEPNNEPEGECPSCGYETREWNISNKRGGSLEIILEEFKRIGYELYWSILNAADYGAPQMRERLIIIGSRDNEPFEFPVRQFLPPQESQTRQLLLADCPKAGGTVVAPSDRRWQTTFESLWANGHPIYGDLDENQAVLWVKNVVRPHDEPVTWNIDRPSPTVGAHQGAKLAIAPYGVPEEQLVRQQWHTRGMRQGDKPPVAVTHEYLSDLELLKLQTFPPHWYIHGTRMERAFQIGNAVPPALGKVLGEAIITATDLKITKGCHSK